jgi:hypothetical protein
MAKLGAINIDDTGRGETWWEFKEDDIADTGVPFDRFNIAAVITGENKVNAPLAGYIGKDKVSWKDRVPYVANSANETIEKENVNEEEPVVKEEPEELDEEAKKFKEYEEDLKADAANDGQRWKKDKDKKENVKGESKSKDDNKEDKKDDKKDESKSKGNENKKENLKSESEKAESKKDNPKDSDGKDKDNKKDDPRKEGAKPVSKDGAKDNPKDDPKANSKDNPKEEAAEKSGKQPGVIEPFNYDEDIEAKEVSGYLDDNFNNNYDRKGDKDKRPFATMFHDILEDFDEEDELTDEFKNTKWWKIPLSDDLPISENMYYPYYSAIYHLKMTYPYINYIKHFKDTGHYHFGMKYDNAGEVKYIIYGIEGNNSSNSQPYMGMTGFIRWIKMKNRDSDRGMWILYYNPHTGNIMIPKKR